jgi:acetyl-CoA carboxylase biotin carboxylase subunit
VPYFTKVLIANRGEIAIRVARACRELGIRSVAVFSDPDAAAPHVRAADEAHALGGVTSAESYLRQQAVIDIALRAGAQAIHPGYGFLAENAAFAAACAANDLVFVGPPPDAMRALGSKTDARRVMQTAGVPVVPGTLDPVADAGEAAALAGGIGYPIALKAVSGGGGKGMRVVERPEELTQAFRQASNEAAASFGDPSLYLERYVVRPRHVEIQFIADAHGNAVHLGERECSVQRRHQKLVEEAPSAVVSTELRQQMGEVAVRAARAVGYTNAGTCEFLLDQSGEFFFLEVNARLQVEHPVTELVTGLDLVHEQMRVAAGLPLSFRQADIELRGHAIEVRVSAEDPANKFFPSIGRVLAVGEPAGPWVRIDGALEAGVDVSLHYDPLLAKLIVWGRDRATAIARMRRALADYHVHGIKTTIPFHRWLMDHPSFQSADLHTGFVDEHWRGVEADDELLEMAAIAAVLAMRRDAAKPRIDAAPVADGRWELLARRAALRT